MSSVSPQQIQQNPQLANPVPGGTPGTSVRPGGQPPQYQNGRQQGPIAGQQGKPPQGPASAEPIRPVRTNTPPRKITNPSIPSRPGANMGAQPPMPPTLPTTPPIPVTPRQPSSSAQPQGFPPPQGYMGKQPGQYQQTQQPQPMQQANMQPHQRQDQRGQPPVPPFPAQGSANALQQQMNTPRPAAYAPTSPKGESLAATSKAADHWRSSWVTRQRAEAGPALGIARGQASVPEPLMAMQNSFIRMRAIIVNQNKKSQEKGMGFRFWVTIIMMFCLVGGLGTYILSTYVTGAPLQNQIATSSNAPDPSIALKSRKTMATAGKLLPLSGSYFGANDTITFVLNTTPIIANGHEFSVTSSSTGTFTANIPVPGNTLAGMYVLRAQDNHTGKHGFLDLQILPATIPVDNTTPLTFSAPSFNFTAPVGRTNSLSQRLGTKNNSNSQLQWTAVAITSDNGNWLSIDNTSATMNPDEPDDNAMKVSVQPLGLNNGTYTGYVIFTVNTTQQVAVPVTLKIVNSAVEFVVNPNPLIAYLGGPGTCLPDTSLTLINLSNSPVSWTASGRDPFSQAHIHLNGQTSATDILQPGSTTVVKITCIGVTIQENIYYINVYYGNLAQHIPVSIRAS